jgi:hypothetical protein
VFFSTIKIKSAGLLSSLENIKAVNIFFLYVLKSSLAFKYNNILLGIFARVLIVFEESQ